MPEPTKNNYLFIVNPKIAAEYSNKNPTPIKEITVGSGKKYIWCCLTCNHEWGSRISHRLSNNSNCPACNKKILTTANPALAAEWGSQNKTTPNDHKPGSRTRVWWSCNVNEHPEYLAAIANRRLLNTGCPLCRKTPPYQKSLAATAPHLIPQWSSQNNLKPEQIYAKAATPVIWECEVCQHTWSTRASYRVINDNGCPKCNNRTLNNKTVAEVLPHLLPQWSKTNVDSPNTIAAGSRKRIIWNCDKENHPDYEMTPKDRRNGYGCKECVLEKKSLSALKPDLTTQWHPTRNHPTSPNTVMKGSGQKAWWLCEKGHEWEAKISDRTGPNNPSGCPICSQSSISSIETELRTAFTQDAVLKNIQQEHNSTLPITWRNRKQVKVDILATYHHHPIIIEYDGWYWHTGQRKQDPATPLLRDTEKTIALLNAGYIVIRIRETRKNETLQLLNITHPNLLQTHWTYNNNSTELRNTIYLWLKQHIPEHQP